MTRPLLLDLFCGAGGSAVGYHRAGFDVVGVDINPQPRYPFEFHQSDALEYLDAIGWGKPGVKTGFAAIHASPPCQRYSASTPGRTRNDHPDILGLTRDLLTAVGLPWVIENVPRAPMRVDYKLCGCMFGLPNLKRERWFEASWATFAMRQPCLHLEPVYSVCGDSPVKSHLRGNHKPTLADWKRSMGIDWMTGKELSQAVPPAYTEHIGRHLLEHLGGDQWMT
jgi:DNA (cytosine-5)-methyltransferase 1